MINERTNREYIRHLFRSILHSKKEFVEYVLDNDYEAPQYIKHLCYKYFEEWNEDAKLMTLNKPSECIYSQIVKYYEI